MITYRYILIGVVALFCTTLLGASLFFIVRTHDTQDTFDGARLVGELYLTLPDTETRKPSVFVIPLQTPSSRTRFFTSEWTSTHGAVFTPDGLTMAYIGEYGEGQIPQLFFAKIDKTGMGQISLDANRVKKNVVWDAQGAHLAYAARAGAIPASEEAFSSYQTFVTDLSGTSSAITGGIPQFFSPDGETLFVMQKGGLRMVPITPTISSTNTVMYSVSSVDIPNARISSSTPLSFATKAVLSPDRHRLVWTLPEQEVMQIYTIENWAPFTLRLEKELSLIATNPVFSPDGAFLAFVDMSVDNAGEKASLMVYDLVSYASRRILDVSAYARDFPELTAWR